MTIRASDHRQVAELLTKADGGSHCNLASFYLPGRDGVDRLGTRHDSNRPLVRSGLANFRVNIAKLSELLTKTDGT